jgi:hypothetical protein
VLARSASRNKSGLAGQRKLAAFRGWLFEEMAETVGRIGPGSATLHP